MILIVMGYNLSKLFRIDNSNIILTDLSVRNHFSSIKFIYIDDSNRYAIQSL